MYTLGRFSCEYIFKNTTAYSVWITNIDFKTEFFDGIHADMHLIRIRTTLLERLK